MLEPLEHRRLLAVVAADADDYAPGDTAIFRADGFQIGETVEFQVLHIDGTPNSGNGHDPWYVVDGGSGDLDGTVDGHLVTSWYVDPDDSAHSTFEVTASGLSSGLTAVDAFTDAPIGNRLKSHQVWDPSINMYVNGLAEDYIEGETASFLVEICVDEADFPNSNPPFETLTFEFDIVLDLDDGPYAFTDLEPFDTTENPTLPIGFSLTETSPDDGDVSVLTPDASDVTVDVTSVAYNGASVGGSGTDNQSWTVTFTIDRPGCVFFVYGGHIAAPGDPLPAAVGGTVPASNGASNIGGTFQARVGGEGVGDKTVNFKGSDIIPLPGIQIDKGVLSIDDEGGGPNDGGGTVNEAGDIINYQVTVTNAGNQDLSDVVVNDPLVTNLALSSGDDSDGVLEVGEVWIYTGSYTVLQADIDSNATLELNNIAAGFIDNTATVDTGETEPQSASVQVPISQNPLLSIVKTGMLNDDDGTPGVSEGDTIDYTFAVSNDGNVTLTNVTVADTVGGVTVLGGPTTLDVGQTDSTTFTGSYTITQDDIDAGSFFNTATADSDESEEASDDETVPLEQAPSYTITKTVTDVDGDGTGVGPVDEAGDVITYQVQVVNTGNQTITGVTLDDSLVAMVGMATETGGSGDNDDGNLDVGETWTWTYTYTVKQADIVNNGGGDGDIDNIATVGSKQLPEMSDSEEVPIVALGDVTGLKFWDRNANGVREVAGADGYFGTPDDEIGLGGWEIVLFADYNRNRLLDQFELDAGPVAVDITSPAGFYAFPQIRAGDYIIVEVVQLGWLQSHPLGSSVLAPGLDTHGVPLGAKGYAGKVIGGRVNPGNDFGNFRIGKNLTLVSAEDWADREFDLTQGDVWFPIEPGTAQELMAHVSYASGVVQLDLYDHNLALVAGGADAGGSQSLSWTRHESEIWYLRLYGSSPSAFLSIYESIRRDGDTVHVQGTPHADDIDFRATGSEYLVSVNGKQYAFNTADVSKFVIEGGAGDDTISLTGTPDNELARLYPGWGKLEGPGYEVTFHEFSSIAVDGAGGSDRALMYDSAGNDRFYAYPNSARMIGGGFVNNVTGFERVYAYSRYGGELDRAYLYDSMDNDILVAKPEYAILRAADSAYYNMARGFDRVFAYAKAGGTLDRAYLYDSAANDIFVGKPEFAQMRDGGNTYLNRATDFDRVYAYATVGGSNDRAFLYDSAEDDIFIGKHDYGLMRRADNQYYNLARYFDRVYAVATTGYDRARLYGTAGSETLILSPAYTSFRGDDFYHRAGGFDDTRAYGGGGDDTAYFKDVAAADQLYGRNNYARLYRGPQKYWAYDFEVVKAYAKDGETATADVDANAVDYLFRQFGSWL